MDGYGWMFYGWMDGWSGWVGGWMDEWMDGWADAYAGICAFIVVLEDEMWIRPFIEQTLRILQRRVCIFLMVISTTNQHTTQIHFSPCT